METQQLQHRTMGQGDNSGGGPDAGANGASLTQQLASLNHLCDTIDHVIDSAAGAVNAQAFGPAFRQGNGE